MLRVLTAARFRNVLPRTVMSSHFVKIHTPNTYPILNFRRMSSETASSEKSILKCLSVIIDPDLHRDIVSLGFVKNLVVDFSKGVVSFDLELTTPACPVKEQFVSACNDALKKNLSWVKTVNVNLTARARASKGGVKGNGLSRVTSIVAVSSCKGGVGKSTVALGLARALREKLGAKVGLLDADVYGPSLPTLLPLVKKGVFDETMSQQVQVYESEEISGLKLMSIGYLKPGESLALRGPMVSGIVTQLLANTGWGDLDFLVIDMPPGTGDIQLTIAQQASIDGAVVVTTPQELSVVDVDKGIELFNKMKIPSIALVENFSFFKCNQCDTKHEIFGNSGDAQKIAKKFGIENVFQIPMETKIFQNLIFEELANSVVREISKLKYSQEKFVYVTDDKLFKLEEGGKPAVSIPFRTLRMECKSASMIDEWTGAKLFNEEDIATDVKPVKVEAAGNYAYRIDWSDGHHSIFPIKALKTISSSI